MASRRRLGVALVLDPPVSDEVQGLRKALGDPSIERVAPHLTLVPPVNVRIAELGAALEILRSAAAAQRGPLRLTLGPPATFMPDNPVLFLDVGGDVDRLRQLRDGVFRPPLERQLSWPWIPHVTLADGIEEERISLALASLDRYAAVADFDRVVMLEEARGRVWRPLGDATLGPPVIIGTGGLAIRITRGRIVDPIALEAIDNDDDARQLRASLADASGSPSTDAAGRVQAAPIVLTAHRAGQLLGTAAVWDCRRGAHAAVFVVPEARGEGTGGHLLAHLESAAHGAGWEQPFLTGLGPVGFYESRSSWISADPRSGSRASIPSDPSPDPASGSPTRTRRRRTAPTS
jgi:2'-5' RNA ligase/GNAT superfamily N-acetyltransferase